MLLSRKSIKFLWPLRLDWNTSQILVSIIILTLHYRNQGRHYIYVFLRSVMTSLMTHEAILKGKWVR